MSKVRPQVASATMSVRAVAEFLGCSIPTVHRLRHAGELPKSFAISKRLRRWRRVDLENWLAAKGEHGG